MKTVAMIPIKTSNQRVPGKNTKMLGGRPMLEYLFDSMSAVRNIDRKCVFCSDEAIRGYIRDPLEFVLRDPRLDGNLVRFNEIFESFRSQNPADIYVVSHVTSPFLRTETIERMVDEVASGRHDSAFTALKIQDFLWNQDGTPLNFDASDVPRSQDLPPVYEETSGAYVFRANVFDKYHRRIGFSPYIAEVSYREAVDVNYPEDFEKATMLV